MLDFRRRVRNSLQGPRRRSECPKVAVVLRPVAGRGPRPHFVPSMDTFADQRSGLFARSSGSAEEFAGQSSRRPPVLVPACCRNVQRIVSSAVRHEPIDSSLLMHRKNLWIGGSARGLPVASGMFWDRVFEGFLNI